MVDGPLQGNGDVGVVAAGSPPEQLFVISKNDFWKCKTAGATSLGAIRIVIPVLDGASYRYEQDMALAETRGAFASGEFIIRTRSWVAATDNLLVIELSCDGSAPLVACVHHQFASGQSTCDSDDIAPIQLTTRQADPQESPPPWLAIWTALSTQTRQSGKSWRLHVELQFPAQYYIAYSANHTEITLPFYKAIVDFVSSGIEMARNHGWKGVHYPTHIGPWALRTEGWEDYLKFENGRYVIYSDSIHEGSGPDCNGVLSLGLVWTLFNSMVKFARDLDIDTDRRAKWLHIVEHLSPFPLQTRNERTVFRYTEAGTEWCDGNGLGIQHNYGGGGIENCGAFAMLNEMLLQSHEGVIRLFPIATPDLRTCARLAHFSFRRLCRTGPSRV